MPSKVANMSTSQLARAPTRISVEVESDFRASHTLLGFETPHFHLWKICASFEMALPLANDRVIDLSFLQETMGEIILPLRGVYLNDAVKFSPTSENIALFIWDQICAKLPEAPLQQVRVKLCDLEGVSTGSARVMK